MKIVHAVHLFHPATGGIETHVLHLCREFVRDGHQVTILTTKVEGAPSEEELEGIKVKRFWSLNFPFVSSVNFSPGLFLELLRQDADVFCSHGYGSVMPLLSSIAAFLKRKPFIFTLHGYPRLKGVLGLFQSLYRIFAASVFLRIAKKVIIVSQKSKEIISKETDVQKVVYIPNGVDEIEKPIPTFDEYKTITYVGRLDEYKGIDVLIRAFAKLNRPELGLDIVGKDEGMKKDLQKLAESLNVRVNFKEVPYSEVHYVYWNSKAIVLPSRYEGFSMVWLEAVNHERPIFSTPVGDAEIFFGDVYGKDAGSFLFKDEAELVEKLRYFLENEAKFLKTVGNAKIQMHKYTWENIAKRTLENY